MDKTTGSIAAFVSALDYAQLSAATLLQTRRRLIDTVACAYGGYSSEPVRIACKIAAAASSRPPARIWASGAQTSVEMAAFANAVMVRYLDYNDTYISTGSGHPSDMIAALLAVGEAKHCSGRELLVSIIAAYEVFTALADTINLRDRGWDQGLFVVLGVAAGAAKLLGLTLQQTGDALAIAVSSNIASRQTRSGELSMWKGCATASAARAGVFAAMLAAEGMTGPTAAFEGKHGIRDQVSGPFELATLGDNGNGYGIERTSLKLFPSEYHSQAPLALALQLRDKVALADIEAVGVQTYHTCYSEIGSEPEKWNPRTRETADHSLPYLLALALTDGTIGTGSFSAEKMQNPALRQLMQRIRIAEDPAYTREYPARLITQIAIVTRSGQRFVDTASYARGHAKNPMSDAETDVKFNCLAEGHLSAHRRAVLLQQLREIDGCADIGTVVDAMCAAQ